MKCEICNRECPNFHSLWAHIIVHKITIKDYYDSYLKQESDGVCCICGNSTKWKNTSYAKTCSRRCASKCGNTKEAIEKRKETRYKHFGGYTNENVLNKQRKTCLEKYGVDNPWKAESCKEKIKQTKLERYGDENYNNPEKNKQTCLEKYGVESHNSLDFVNEKRVATFRKNYNGENLEKLVAKRKETRYKHFGGYTNQEILDKQKETCLTKYGVECPLQNVEINRLRPSKYLYDNENFDSSWELAYYIWLKDNNINFTFHNDKLPYKIDGKLHYYQPDFKVNETFIEIKGPHQLTENNEIIDPFTGKILYEKTQCMKDNNVIIISDCSEYLNYIKCTYGKDYLKQFKNA